MTMLAIKYRTARLGEQLVEDAIITPIQLEEALDSQNQTGAMLGETLVVLGHVPADVIGRYLEKATGFPFVDLTTCEIDAEIPGASGRAP